MSERVKRLALVASKGTLDQAYPPLILATTAVAMGWEVGIFFTFYGLNILHRDRLEHLFHALHGLRLHGHVRLVHHQGGAEDASPAGRLGRHPSGQTSDILIRR